MNVLKLQKQQVLPSLCKRLWAVPSFMTVCRDHNTLIRLATLGEVAVRRLSMIGCNNGHDTVAGTDSGTKLVKVSHDARAPP